MSQARGQYEYAVLAASGVVTVGLWTLEEFRNVIGGSSLAAIYQPVAQPVVQPVGRSTPMSEKHRWLNWSAVEDV
eukprot:g32551.t1